MILLTGFGKYGKFTYNLSEEVVRGFTPSLNNHLIKKLVLPVSWKRSYEKYHNNLFSFDYEPTLVVLLGIYSSKSIGIEKRAWNFSLGNDIDNNFKFGFISLNAKIWLKTNLNLKKLFTALRKKIFLSLSNFPGLYLCNYIYFKALLLSKGNYPVVFIHIPWNGILENMIKKIEEIIKEILELL
jgi:pyrrolidone-carboxylate peptidase